MAKGSFRANLQATRTQMNNARTSAQTRAFKARQVEKQKRAAEERKLRAAQEKAAKAEKAGKVGEANAVPPDVVANADALALETSGKDAPESAPVPDDPRAAEP